MVAAVASRELQLADFTPRASSKSTTSDALFSQARPESPPGGAELLQCAQVALIKEQYTTAVHFLRAAVEFDDTTAAITLGRLLLQTTNSDSLIDPTRETISTTRGIDAAEVFARGIEVELAKPHVISRANTVVFPSHVESQHAGKQHSRGSSASSDPEFDETSLGFALERLQDLIVGLTACCRYGFLPGPSVDKIPPLAAPLAQKAEHLARQALLHPAVANSKLAALVVSAPTPPHSPPLPLTPTLVFALASPAREATGSGVVAWPQAGLRTTAPACPRQVQLRPETKQRLTIQVSALYILALQAWPRRRDSAFLFWQAVIDVAGSVGGIIGSKEGDEIVSRAKQRIQTERESLWQTDVAIKLSDGQTVDKIGHNSWPREASEDALVEMARQRDEQARAKGTSSSASLGRTIGAKGARSEYPSPPETPQNSPPFDNSCAPVVDSDQRRSLRRMGSTTGFQPPKILRRVTSSTSISTLPPNFGSARPRVITSAR
ncbi:hypothetical protein OIO90_001452 [Microbotryomycetes sp. JL221]|nr:hypothetical protein OIO90_001452 [Microbotryomycetes sp. JL221]